MSKLGETFSIHMYTFLKRPEFMVALHGELKIATNIINANKLDSAKSVFMLIVKSKFDF